MIKMVIFDLDGVLVDARDLHYEAMNKALLCAGFPAISRDEHLSKYDGLPTKKKLDLLTDEYKITACGRAFIWEQKQAETIKIIRQTKPDKRMVRTLADLKEDGYTICVASNSVRKTVQEFVRVLGLEPCVDFLFSNEAVQKPKPATEIYLRCMIAAGVDPVETLIIEDSPVGRKAAQASGAHLLAVNNSKDVTYERIKAAIDKANRDGEKPPKWNGGKMNVVIPMAGEGSRFADAGYTFPKPLIDVNGKPMIQAVVENLNIDAQYTFIIRREHNEQYNLSDMLQQIVPGSKSIVLDGVTEGAACTLLMARQEIDNDEPLIFANCDQLTEWDSSEFMWAMNSDGVDGGILTFTGTHPKWSFVKIGEDGWIVEVAEKKPISDRATVGIYYWKRGSDFVKYADQMIKKDIRTNGEFYAAPVFNEAIADGKKIKEFRVEKMMGLGTPEDLEHYLRKA